MNDPSSATAAPGTEVKYVRWNDVAREMVNPLFDRQIVVGNQIMVARILLKKGAVIPPHSHLNEQISLVESGAIQFAIEGREVTLREGELLCIPSDVPHSAVALEDFTGFDIFTPPRADWLAKTDHYLRGA
jgi:quercetin dioxygenase-like cupin family protein